MIIITFETTDMIDSQELESIIEEYLEEEDVFFTNLKIEETEDVERNDEE